MPNTSLAKTWIPGVQFAKELGGDFPMISWEANSSAGALARGQLVKKVSGVLVASAIADTFVYGATLAAAATSGANVPVALASRQQLFVCQASTAFAAASFPCGCDFVLGTPNKINVAGVTTKVIRCVDYMRGDDVADTVNPARIIFFIQASQYDVVSTTP